MRKTGLALVATVLLGLGGCTYSAVTQSGGSGLEDSYGYSPGPQGCPPGDTNCWQFYNSPGGG